MIYVMEYYPQESAMLDVARERIYSLTVSKARRRQIKTVLDACKSDTEMFVMLSDLLFSCEKKLPQPEYETLADAVTALLSLG